MSEWRMDELDIFGTKFISEEDRVDTLRRQLLNLVTSYSDEADVFTELIQNAVDALQAKSFSRDEAPELLIVIGRRSNEPHYVYVEDNGSGMSPEVASQLCVPGFSRNKTRGRTIGYKGVGASYVAAVSTWFALWSRSDTGATTERTIRHAFDWIVDSDAPAPTVTTEFEAPEVVRKLASKDGSGTGVLYQFHSGHKPTSLDNMVLVGAGAEKELTYWAAFLAARTPVGEALRKGDSPRIPNCSIKLVLDRGEDSQVEATFTRDWFMSDYNQLGYPFPDLVYRVSKDIQEIEEDLHKTVARAEFHLSKYASVHHRWTGSELVQEMGDVLDDEEQALLSHLDWVYGYLCYSTDVLKEVNKTLGSRTSLIRWGAKLIVEGVPQGRPLDLALTSDQGLDRQTHIALGFDQLELDTGRKFISDEKVLSAVAKVNQRVVTKLKTFRPYLKRKLRPEVASEIDKWITATSARRGNSIVPALLHYSKLGSALMVDPGSENDVIALWGGLVAGGAVPGFNTITHSGINRYDALFDLTQEALTGDAEVDKLAPVSSDIAPKKNAVLEFKLDFVDLIRDFESGDKIPSEIDLVVCWSSSDLNLRRGTLTPVYGPEWRHSRPARGVSYIWRDDAGDVEIMVIALANLAAELLTYEGDDQGKIRLADLEARDKRFLV